MRLIDRTPPPTYRDRAWRTIYRLGFPVAREWWRLRRSAHVGALVAIYVGDALLLIRSSYRTAWNLPGGGVERGEAPSAAAARELREEIGLCASIPDPATIVTGLWDGRHDEVHIFRLTLDAAPTLRLDNRETIAARLVTPAELTGMALTGPVAAYLGLPPLPRSAERSPPPHRSG